MARSIDEAPFVDFTSPEFQADPVPFITTAREQCWFAQTPIGILVISREKVHQLLADPRLRSSVTMFVQMQGAQGDLLELVRNSILAIDGDDHTRLRKLVSRAFTPRSVEVLRPVMRELAQELVDDFAPTGRCEFMHDFADHYPIQIICEHLGVPREDHDRFAEWGNGLTWLLSLQLAEHLDEAERGLKGLNDYVTELIADRRRTPRDDMVSRMVAADDDGDRLDEDELRMLIAALLFAGFDTTRNQLGLCLTTFCDHPDQWVLLADRPELVGAAVEECMRFGPTIAIAPRMAAETFELDGFEIPAGTLMSLSTISANNDPAAYDAPDRFDITAEREPIYTFGGGPHYCLGASLARAEMQEVLPLLARRMPDVALDGEPTWRPQTGIFGPTYLPLRFTPTTSAFQHSEIA